jgi:hypothetical protein
MKQLRKAYRSYIYAIAVLLTCCTGVFAGAIPDTGDPSEPVCHPRSFIDLGNGMITDTVTGLMWQKDSAPETYTWRDARQYVESLTLGGYDDWRLPTVQELSMLVDPAVKNPSPAIDTTYFADTRSDFYWTSTVGTRGLWKAWAVDFSSGYVNYKGRMNTFYVRAVRGTTAASSLVDNGDGTITDTSTGLMWQKDDAKNTYTWEQSKIYCDNLTLSGYTDWRLPTRNELQTLINYRCFNPAISMSFTPSFRNSYFPGTAMSHYWTSTTNATSDEVAWYVNFKYGVVYYIDKSLYNHVRAVRALNCGQ